MILLTVIQCTPLPDIPNGRIEYGPDMTPNYMLGTTSTYICNNGFFLDLSAGNEIRTCEDDNGLDDLGEFTGSQPTCVRKYSFMSYKALHCHRAAELSLCCKSIFTFWMVPS